MNDPHLILDGWIDLTGICDDAGWHNASAIAALTELGIDTRDAECFIDYAFAEHLALALSAWTLSRVSWQSFLAAVTDGAELTPEQAVRLKRE